MKNTRYTLLLFLLFPVYLMAQSPRAVQSTSQDKSENERIRRLNRISWDLHYQSPEKAVRYGKQAIKISRSIGYWEGLAFASKHTGAAYTVLGKYDSASVYLNQAHRLFEESGDRTQAGNVSNLIGLLFWEKGDYDSAMIAYDDAFKQFEATSDQEGKAIIYSNRGIICYEKGDYTGALSNYSRCLRISEQLHDSNTLSSVHTNIGIIYSSTGNYQRAIAHHRSALGYDNLNRNPSGCAKYFTNIGTCYFHLKDYDSSLYFHQKALTIYQKIREQKGIAHSFLNIGSIFQEKRNYSDAETYFRRGLDIKKKMGDQVGIVIGETFLGKFYLHIKRYADAETCLLNAYNRASRLKALSYTTEISLMLAQVYDQLGNANKSNYYFRKYAQHNAQLVAEKGNHRFSELQIGLATHEKQQVIAQLQRQQNRDKQQRYLLVTSLVLLLAASVILVRSIRKRHLKKQALLQSELEENKQLLEQFTRELADRSIEPETETTDIGEKLQAIQQLGQSRLITEDDWERFKVLFDKVYPLFMVGLKNSFPDITPAELRLAALLLLKLSGREIASILGISPESVKKARQRLRKKLAIPAETELEHFLSSFVSN